MVDNVLGTSSTCWGFFVGFEKGVFFCDDALDQKYCYHWRAWEDIVMGLILGMRSDNV